MLPQPIGLRAAALLVAKMLTEYTAYDTFRTESAGFGKIFLVDF